MIRLLGMAVLLLLGLTVAAHSGKPSIHLIIDTDGAADDLRTICMLLGSQEVEVMAITTSEGALLPGEGKRKVTALLNSFYHQGIPVAAGRIVGSIVPQWRGVAMQLDWGMPVVEETDTLSAKDLLIKTIKGEPKKVTFVCLGALTNVRNLLADQPQLVDRIERVVWYNSGEQPMRGINYAIDSVAAREVMNSGVEMRLVSAKTDDSVPVSMFYLMELERLQESPYVQKVVTVHVTPPLISLIKNEHLRVWDELTVLSFFAPQLFTVASVSPKVEWYCIDTKQLVRPIEKELLRIFKGKENAEGKVFYDFPVAEKYYFRDVMPMIEQTIKQYGASEWRAAVLTNELHGHLGIYATIGVKMGIRAREYFAIGVDDMHVTSFAGNKPPVSCLNDGLQVSTGGTLGHGLIQIAEDEDVRPEATFVFKDRRVTLRLKPEYARQVQEDLRKGVEMYGADTEENWKYVRRLAIQYWQDWDRHCIFEIEG